MSFAICSKWLWDCVYGELLMGTDQLMIEFSMEFGKSKYPLWINQSVAGISLSIPTGKAGMAANFEFRT